MNRNFLKMPALPDSILEIRRFSAELERVKNA
jgi:hypothetical protein